MNINKRVEAEKAKKCKTGHKRHGSWHIEKLIIHARTHARTHTETEDDLISGNWILKSPNSKKIALLCACRSQSFHRDRGKNPIPGTLFQKKIRCTTLIYGKSLNGMCTMFNFTFSNNIKIKWNERVQSHTHARLFDTKKHRSSSSMLCVRSVVHHYFRISVVFSFSLASLKYGLNLKSELQSVAHYNQTLSMLCFKTYSCIVYGTFGCVCARCDSIYRLQAMQG